MRVSPGAAAVLFAAGLLAGCKGATPLATLQRLAAARPELAARLAPGVSRFEAAGTALVSASWRAAASRPAHELVARLPATADVPYEIGIGRGDRYQLRLTTEGAAPAPIRAQDGRAFAENLFPSTDAAYVTDAQRFELLFLLAHPGAPADFSLRIELPSGLPRAHMEAGGALVFADRSGVAQLRIPQPYAIDAHGTRRDAQMSWDGSHLRMHLRTDGLAYPILLDPAVETVVWSEVATTGPSLRSQYGFAFDSDRNRTVLFGGWNGSADQSDTWEWDGTTWTEAATSGPPARDGLMLAYDSTHLQTLLFGGQVVATSSSLGDTWVWNGTSWSQLSPAASPGPRHHGAMVYDVQSGLVVLFGGYGLNLPSSKSATQLNDTWTWNGTTWAQLSPTTKPTARQDHALVYDSANTRLLLFGGYGPPSGYRSDTWSWNGTTWTQLSPTTSPSARDSMAMAFDSVRGRTVLFGGNSGAATLGDTWEYDGTTWTQLATTGPSADQFIEMAFDSSRRRAVLFTAGNTWELHTHGESCSTGTTCDTGRCVDGVCCEQSSCGTCQACNTATAPGVCTNLVDVADPDSCPTPSQCDNGNGVCLAPNGTACSGGGSCITGSCVNGYCCNSACNGGCDACNGADLGWSGATNGTCAVASSGFAGSPACTPYLCDGSSGACPGSCSADTGCVSGDYCAGSACVSKQANGNSCTGTDQCTSGNCVDGYCCNTTCGGACDACNGAALAWGGAVNGTCALAPASYGGAPSCGAYLCSGTGAACPSSCSSDSNCTAADYCSSNVCVARQAAGALCTAADQCASGHCTPAFDGSAKSYCTTSGCAACQGGTSSGTCQNATLGQDPTNSCAVGSSNTCQPGYCNGSGACDFAPASTDCGTSCAGSTLTSRTCDGAGSCVVSAGACAGHLVCASATACDGSCSVDTDCTSGYYCAAGNVCKAQGGLGAACTATDQCQSGFCSQAADGSGNRYCSSAACSGCMGANNSGACVDATSGTDPNGACPATACAPGTCNNAGACTINTGSTCATSCSGSTLTTSTCNSGGSCVAGAPATCAGNFACASGTACKTSCSVAGDCASGYSCSGGACVAQTGLANGQPCTTGSQCNSTICTPLASGSGSVCAATSCSGCTGANAAGSACIDATSGTDPNSACAAATCKPGTCNGGGACTIDANTVCATSCSGGQLTTSTCDAAANCIAGAPTSCGGFACADAQTCGASCSSDAQCVSGDYCTANACQTAAPPGSSCTANDQCQSGACSPAASGSGSLCAQTACSGCMGSDASGNCVPAAAGSNPNGACVVGPSSICQPGVCDGQGACTLLAAGADCGSSCSGGGLEAATCDGAGSCDTVSQSCGAYACVGSACKTECASGADCASGSFECIAGACVSGMAPSITSSGQASGRDFEAYLYDAPANRVTATGTPPITYGVAAPAGAIIDPISGRLYYTPTAAGSVGFTVTASNPWGTDSKSFVVSVAAPSAPLFTHDANGTALVGTPYALNAGGVLGASGAAPMSFAKVAGPAELHVDAATGQVDWTPTAAGSANITVRATNPWGADQYAFTVAVTGAATHAPPTASAIATPASGQAPLQVKLDSSGSMAAAGSAIVSRSWVFGDGTPPSTAATPTHVYAAGAYLAHLTVLDSLGLAASASAAVQAGVGPAVAPPVKITAMPVSGAAPLSVTFSCGCTQVAGTTLHWDFGDGGESSEPAPTYIYAQPGGYQVTLEALDEDSGQVGVDTAYITALAGTKQPPLVRAFADPVVGNAPLTVKFASRLGDPDGRVVSWQWVLGDSDTSTDASPQKTFQQPGLYHIVLRAIDNDGLQSTAAVDVQVTRENELPPSIFSLALTGAHVGVPYRYAEDGRAHARGSRPLSWSLGKMINGQMVNAPAGMTIDPASGAISWTPTADQAGPQPVTVVVQNGAGADFQDFLVSVAGGASAGSRGCSFEGTPSPGSPAAALLLLGLIGLMWRRHLG